MKHIVAKLLALIALACSLATTARAESFAKRVDIGGGRMMYIEWHGSGSPTVLLISGTPPDFGAVVDRTNSAAQYDFRLRLKRLLQPTGGHRMRGSLNTRNLGAWLGGRG